MVSMDIKYIHLLYSIASLIINDVSYLRYNEKVREVTHVFHQHKIASPRMGFSGQLENELTQPPIESEL